MKGLALIFISMSVSHRSHAVVSHSYANDGIQNNSINIWTQCWNPNEAFNDYSTAGANWAGCVKHRMYLGLIECAEQRIVDIGDGVTFVSDDKNDLMNPRDLFPLGEEPSTFRALADAYSTFLGRRGIRWDLSQFYPGLVLRVGPTINGDGVIEFIMDRRLDYNDRAKLGPGQQMVRRTILPHLLGFRMNVLRLLPLLFGIMLYAAKNAFIFSKVTLVLSTLLTLKSLFLLQHLRLPVQQHGNDYLDSSSAANDPLAFIGQPKPKPHHSPDGMVFQMFSESLPPFRGVNDKHQQNDDSFRRVRGFSWQ